uniref:Elongator complex protein 2 n=1 Tax=Ananas comosus var. bracteatus TaxID=296719 RepID=A0A6V7QWZ0_ANACO
MAARVVGGGVAVERVFIGAGCNRIVNNVSWSPSGLVAFGAQNAVAIFSPESTQILTTLPGHKAVVNCTQWLPTNKDAIKVQDMERHYLLSGSADGVIMIWKIHPKKREWSHMLQVPEMHKRGVTCLTGMMISDVAAIFASTSSDGVVLIWKTVFSSTVGGKCNVSCLDSLSVGSKPMVALSVAALPGNKSHAILAMGGLDLKVHIYFGDQTGKFTHACDLKGHADWIRSLDFSLPVILDSEKHNLFLVSSSQDKTIRIWKMAAHALSSGSPIQSRKEDIGLTSYIEGPIFVAGSSSYQVSLESLLVGHEDWVYSVEWQPPSLINGTNCHQPMSILSASMDKTMMIWRPEKNHWNLAKRSDRGNAGLDYENWQPQKVPSGHFASVSDLTWAKSGKYLLSISHDQATNMIILQTARVFAPWRIEETSGDKVSWHEIARPQVHGHDINCVTFIQGAGNHRFVSGADEKVARVFEAPLSFLKTLHHAMSQNNFYDFHEQVQVLGANMSALGLSQKPIYMHTVNESPASLHNDGADSLEAIPDAVPTGKLIASSCKAQTATVAEIWLWEVGSWKAGSAVLSVLNQQNWGRSHPSVDCQARGAQKNNMGMFMEPFSHEFATGSRDKTVKVWSVNKEASSVDLLATLPQFRDSVTALSWVGRDQSCNAGFLAVGMDNGLIELWSLSGGRVAEINDMGTSPFTAVCAIRFDPLLCHVSTVHRLRWRNPDFGDTNTLQLASCGADQCVRVFEVSGQ